MDSYHSWEELLQYRNVNNSEMIPSFWFVDRVKYAGIQGQLPDNSNSSAISPDDVNPAAPRYGMGVFKGQAEHLTSNNTNSFYMGPQGIIQQGKYYIELSLTGMFGEIDYFDVQDGWEPIWTLEKSSSYPYGTPIFDVDNEALKTLQYLRTPGQKFKWEGGDEIFTIDWCELEWRYNYMDYSLALEEHYDDIAYSTGATQNPPGDLYRQQFKDPINRRLTAVIQIREDKNPIAYTDSNGDTIDITDSSQTNAYTSRRMIFLSQNIDVGEGEGLKTSNPAVFEVAKTDEEKLDIYYEISDELPVRLDSQSLR